MAKELDTFMYDYGFMFRHAFNRYIEIEKTPLDGDQIQKEVQKLEKDLSSRTNYPIRVAKDAVQDAIQLVKAQHELMKDYLKLWAERYENTKKCYDKLLMIPTVHIHSLKMIGLRNKMEKQVKKMNSIQLKEQKANEQFLSPLNGTS